jgi:hypothetical protein
LSDQVKEKMKNYKYSKELWLQLENSYHNETQEEEKFNESEEQDSTEDDSYQNKEQNSKEESSYQDNEEDKEKENLSLIEEHISEKNISNLNEMKDSILVNSEEDNLIKELRNTSVFIKEKLHYLKTDFTTL